MYVVDLHRYNWNEIDKGWKIDGKDISIENFFENMYNMTDKQRTYLAIEIDNFRLIALALLNNDLIAISDSSVAADILSGHKDKILSQKEMCSEIKKRLPLLMDELWHKELAKLREKKETTEEQIAAVEKAMKTDKEDVSRYVKDLENRGIAALYYEHIFQYLNSSDIGFNLGHVATRKAVQEGLIGE
ncbi:MAG: hypothetical protein ACR5KX_04445 [Wolbachia sp.]